MESKAIRLTNKMAVALRENAKKTRNAYFIVGAAGTLALLGAAVYFGMQWLPAVPLLLAAAVAMDALLALGARRAYLQLIGQAICTEAAARQIREKQSERSAAVRPSAIWWRCSRMRSARRRRLRRRILPMRWGRRAACPP